MDKHSITRPTQIFNLDGPGSSIREVTIGDRSKCVVSHRSRENTIEPKFRRSCDHVALMPVMTASGKALMPVVVLPGKKAQFKKRTNGVFETPSDFLPQPHYSFIRLIAGVEGNISLHGLLILLMRLHVFDETTERSY